MGICCDRCASKSVRDAMAVGKHEMQNEFPLRIGQSLLEIVAAENCPQLDYLSESDPYVVIWTENRLRVRTSSKRSFPYCLNSANPIWCLKRVLNKPLAELEGANPSDVLVLQVFNVNGNCSDAICGGDVIGTAKVSVAEIQRYGIGTLIKGPLKLSRAAQKVANRKNKNTLTERSQTIFDGWSTQDDAQRQTRCTITFRVWPAAALSGWPSSKWIFLIRHGESMWNEGQSTRNLRQMLAKDHPLSEKGLVQCLRLASFIRQRLNSNSSKCSHTHSATSSDFEAPHEVYDTFFTADKFLSSPLTRAIQTALIALQHHPQLQQEGLHLRSEVREVKTAVGLDTLARHKGDKIVEHATIELKSAWTRMMHKFDSTGEELRSTATTSLSLGQFLRRGAVTGKTIPRMTGRTTDQYSCKSFKDDAPWDEGEGEDDAQSDRLNLQNNGEDVLWDADMLERCLAVPMDTGNTQHEWWSTLKESPHDVQTRVNEMLTQLKLSPTRAAVITGHSLFFRHLVGNCMSVDFQSSHPEVAEVVRKKKLPNCGVLALRLNLNLPLESCVDRVHTMFCTSLEDHHCLDDHAHGYARSAHGLTRPPEQQEDIGTEMTRVKHAQSVRAQVSCLRASEAVDAGHEEAGPPLLAGICAERRVRLLSAAQRSEDGD